MMSNLSLHQRLALIIFLYHGGVIGMAAVFIVIGVYFGIHVVFDIGGFMFLAHVISFQRLPFIRLLQQRLINGHQCSCGYSIPMWGRWRCKCKAVTYRHALSTACPRCQVGFDSINCPRCSSTHIL